MPPTHSHLGIDTQHKCLRCGHHHCSRCQTKKARYTCHRCECRRWKPMTEFNSGLDWTGVKQDDVSQ